MTGEVEDGLGGPRVPQSTLVGDGERSLWTVVGVHRTEGVGLPPVVVRLVRGRRRAVSVGGPWVGEVGGGRDGRKRW